MPVDPRPPLVTFAEVLHRESLLNKYGFGVHHDRQVDGEERIRDLDRLRRALASQEEHVRRVHDWLVVNVAQIKTPTISSYEMKHVVEHALGDYTANGELMPRP